MHDKLGPCAPKKEGSLTATWEDMTTARETQTTQVSLGVHADCPPATAANSLCVNDLPRSVKLLLPDLPKEGYLSILHCNVDLAA